ncbi:MAG: hypothetical protein EBS01_02855 [Verrucomicrobia bacterium]|nr:hypothetical protein [Verrucomicrobiota bacterium]
MENPKKNQRFRVIRPTRGYELNKVYRVVRVDNNDDTLIGVDSEGKEGSWIKFDSCISAGPNVSWEWLKGQLPGEVLELLSAFEGLEGLRLKNEVRDHILMQLPNLKERILSAQITMEEQGAGLGSFGESADSGLEESEEEEPCPFGP